MSNEVRIPEFMSSMVDTCRVLLATEIMNLFEEGPDTPNLTHYLQTTAFTDEELLTWADVFPSQLTDEGIWDATAHPNCKLNILRLDTLRPHVEHTDVYKDTCAMIRQISSWMRSIRTPEGVSMILVATKIVEKFENDPQARNIMMSGDTIDMASMVQKCITSMSDMSELFSQTGLAIAAPPAPELPTQSRLNRMAEDLI